MTQLSFAQIEQLWVANGGSAALAPVMAAVSIAESGGRTDAHNYNPATGDDSYGLWQINYYGSLLSGRTQRYGAPQQLVADPNLQARAALSLAGNGSGLSNWTTYTSGAYKAPLQANVSGLSGTGGGTGAGELAAGPNIQLAADEVAPGPDFNKNATDTTEGHWVIGPGPFQIEIQRATFRKACSAVVLVGGAAVALVGVGLVVKTAALQGITSPLTKAMNRRSAQAASLQKEQLRQEGLLQRQQEKAQERRRDKYETVDPQELQDLEPF